MPVILIKAVMVDKAEVRDAYICPVYKTTSRGPTYVRACALASMPAVRAMGGCCLCVRARHSGLGAQICRAQSSLPRGPLPWVVRYRWVFNGQMRTKYDQSKWILAGVALIMDVVFA